MEYRNTCTNCRHAVLKESEEPCHECLDIEANKGEAFNKWEEKK